MRGSPVYYGWFVLGASAISEMLVQGATSYAGGLFVLPLQAEFHISRANANSSVLILFFGAMVVAPLAGRILDVWPIRLVMTLGAILLGASFAAIAMAPALWIMALILLLPTAIAFMTLGPLNTSTLASRWFHRRRGLALGLAAVATSGGGFTVVPLLSAAIQHYGWRRALLYEGLIITLVIIVLTLLFLRDRPSDVGLKTHAEVQKEPQSPLRANFRTLFASSAFWIPSLTLAGISGTCQATVLTLVPYGVELGFGAGRAALLVGAFALIAGVTKVLAGLLADYLNQRHLLIAAALCMTLSWLILTLPPSYGVILASACLAGIALGCALPTVAALIAASFGSRHFGSVMGWTYAMTAASAILAGRFVGSVFDHFGGYHLAFVTFTAILALLSLLTFLVTPQPKIATA